MTPDAETITYLWTASLTIGVLGLIPIVIATVRWWLNRRYTAFINELIVNLAAMHELRELRKAGDGKEIQRKVKSEVERLCRKYFWTDSPPALKAPGLKAILRKEFNIKMKCFICEENMKPRENGGCPECGLFCLVWAIDLPVLFEK